MSAIDTNSGTYGHCWLTVERLQDIDPDLRGEALHEAVASVMEQVPEQDRASVFIELDERPGQFPGYTSYSIGKGNPEWHWKLRRTRNSGGEDIFARLTGR
jgi:hypothetical protein